MKTRKTVSALLFVGMALLAAGCGKTAFQVTSAVQMQQAPGEFMIPAKVDILLAEDDSGSMADIFRQVKDQMPGFLNALEGRGWDYHFATTPLTYDRPLDQIVPSRYDGNWGALWLPPYPGAPITVAEMVPTQFFREPGNYTGFINSFSNYSNANEGGLETIHRTLVNRASGTGFVRPDAMLVVLVVGNGQDTSRVNYCDRGDGIAILCEDLGQPACTDIGQAGAPGATCGSTAISHDFYKSQLQGLKAAPGLFKLYSAVAKSQNTSAVAKTCLGKTAFIGHRYVKMATETGGQSYDICTEPVNSVLDNLSTSLQNTRLAMRTRYLFIDREPELTSIVVTRHRNGVAETVPMDAINGWTYEGYLTNVPAIVLPFNGQEVPMSYASGFAIKLNGSAELVGNDYADVVFQNKGAQNTITQ